MEKLNVEKLSGLNVNVQMALKKNKSWRAGQALFNCLEDINPELANSVRGTDNDPFYRNDRIQGFFKAICDEDAYKIVNPKFK